MRSKLILTSMGLMILLLNSCNLNVKKQVTECRVPKDEFFNYLVVIACDYNLDVKYRDDKNGSMILSSASIINDSIGKVNVWKIHYIKDTVYAYAQIKTIKQNKYGTIIGTDNLFIDDDTSKQRFWYWKIREYIEKRCGNKTTLIEIERPSLFDF